MSANDLRSNTNTTSVTIESTKFFLKDVWLQSRDRNIQSVLRANELAHLRMLVEFMDTMSISKSLAIPATNNTKKCLSGWASSMLNISIPKKHPEKCNVEWPKAKMRIDLSEPPSRKNCQIPDEDLPCCASRDHGNTGQLPCGRDGFLHLHELEKSIEADQKV